MIRIIILLFALFTLNACTTPQGGVYNPVAAIMPVAPSVSLKGITLTKMGLSEQTYRLRLYVKNPNAFALPIQSLNYQLSVNNKSFAQGTNTQPVTIPGLGEGYIETDITSNIANVVDGWQQWLSLAKRTLDYNITGQVNVTNLSIPMPFQYGGQVDLALTQ